MRGQHFSVMDVFYGLVNHLYDEGSAKCIICLNSGMKNEALESWQNLILVWMLAYGKLVSTLGPYFLSLKSKPELV